MLPDNKVTYYFHKVFSETPTLLSSSFIYLKFLQQLPKMYASVRMNCDRLHPHECVLNVFLADLKW